MRNGSDAGFRPETPPLMDHASVVEPNVEDNPRGFRASNDVALRALALLGRACRALADGLPRGLEQVLALAVEAGGAERGFLVRTGDGSAFPDDQHVLAASSSRLDGRHEPSRSALRRAVSPQRTDAVPDAASVRALRLRSILTVPIPVAPPCTAALVLDSRVASSFSCPSTRDIVNAFAALLAAGLGSQPGFAAGSAPRTGPSDDEDKTAYISPAYCEMRDWVGRVALTDLPVLVHGESGSGKERVSRAVHRQSARRDAPFVPVNCSTLTETLLDAELFGAMRGAYTGADRDRPGLFRLAHGGTLFLDEVGDMPLPMQVKLLRVLEQGRVRPVGGSDEKTVDVRIVAATHRNLERFVADGRFRPDLYYRLAVLRVNVPSLRDRLEDLETLVAGLATRLCRQTGRPSLRLTADAWLALRSYSWPGNIRELGSVLARAMLRSDGPRIGGHDLRPLLDAPGMPSNDDPPAAPLERTMIESALRESYDSVRIAAGRIGWSRQKLYRRMKALGIG